ncbi:MAG: hypothetical protein M3P12_12520 [Gemmatimonadota bacterium]|nr:hypothetical protein [Gemmatimonadota bacterium]
MARFAEMNIDDVQPLVSGPEPGSLIHGSPEFRSWSLDEADDGVSAGLWEATPGASRTRLRLRHAVAMFSVVAFFSPAAPEAQALKPVIDNERVAVWKVSGGDVMRPQPSTGESIEISLGPSAGAVVLRKKGDARQTAPPAVVVELKDHPMTPRINRSGYPNAFPRPRGRKVLETGRVVVWDYSWTRGQPTPMHYHDKDVVVVYLADGALRSTTPTGEETLNDYKAGDIRFNLGDRVHSEDLATGDQHAIIIELK